MRASSMPCSDAPGVEPVLFASCFGEAPRLAGAPESMLACVFAWDPSQPRLSKRWGKWGDAMQMCDWKGGAIDGGALDDFMVFSPRAPSWLSRAGMELDAAPAEIARWMAMATMDFLAERYGAPIGNWVGMWWMEPALGPTPMLGRIRLGKLSLRSNWEAHQLASACPSSSQGAHDESRRL